MFLAVGQNLFQVLFITLSQVHHHIVSRMTACEQVDFIPHGKLGKEEGGGLYRGILGNLIQNAPGLGGLLVMALKQAGII